MTRKPFHPPRYSLIHSHAELAGRVERLGLKVWLSISARPQLWTLTLGQSIQHYNAHFGLPESFCLFIRLLYSLPQFQAKEPGIAESISLSNFIQELKLILNPKDEGYCNGTTSKPSRCWETERLVLQIKHTISSICCWQGKLQKALQQ